MRRCKIPTGCKRRDTPCCEDCKDKTCPALCRNSPKWCNCCEEAPPPRRGNNRKYDPDEVLRLHENGLTQAQIAARLGANRNTIGIILRKMGVRDGNP